MIYLDSNATSQIEPMVLEAMLPFFGPQFGNPSSPYRAGREARQAVDTARQSVAASLGARAEEIIFTGSGTEANNAAIDSAKSRWPERRRLVIGATEHPAVLQPAKRWAAEGGEVITVPVDHAGLVDMTALRAAVTAQTALVSVMWANNETGVLAPIAEITGIAHAAGALMHSDAVPAFGKVPIDVAEVAVDFLSLSGHKFHAPKGIGVLYASRRVGFRPQMLGGGQESGRRSGTENVPYIVGIARAAEMMQPQPQIQVLRDQLESALISQCGAHRNGDALSRLPTTSSLAFAGLEAAGLLILLDAQGLACSAGSACHSAAVHPSHVLEAMGYSAAHAASTLRFSLCRYTTASEIEEAIEMVTKAVGKLRSMNEGGLVQGH
jgi:cysteine desulfurase